MTVQAPLVRPEYAAGFRCIGAACEDSCCAGWNVVFDEAACGKYRAVSAGPLRVLLDANIVVQPSVGEGMGLVGAAPFAKVRMTAENACPFLNEEQLCRIQVELGEEALSTTCKTYPRIVHRADGMEEIALSLSCPEAARMVLLAEDLLEPVGKQYQVCWEETGGVPAAGMAAYFWPVREFVIGLLRNRRYALWQRLFLVGVFVRQLDGLAGGRAGRGFEAISGGFRVAVQEGGLRGKMEGISPDLRLQLDVVLRLAGMRLSGTPMSERFTEIVDRLRAGIGYGPGATMETLIAGYAGAYEKFYRPFFERHSWILENLLVNTVFRTLFPYGLKVGDADWRCAMEEQFCLLAAQFALIKGLLIGVAGFRREAFSVEDVVFTVQAVSKHFEHHPRFLEQVTKLLEDGGLNNLRGMTMLVRN